MVKPKAQQHVANILMRRVCDFFNKSIIMEFSDMKLDVNAQHRMPLSR